MRGCVFPGSFDPPTRGHLDLIRRASGIFDTVTVTVMVNIHKSGCIPVPERIEMLQKICAGLPNVRVDQWDGLLSEYIRIYPDNVVIRGVRDNGEFETEIRAATINHMLNSRMETLLLPASDDFSRISSSAVREIASFGGDYGFMVPECIRQEIDVWLKK